MKRIILGSTWPGLGDHLQFSTLPEVYAANGYEVYISEESSYRNPEIKDLVWRTNPFVKGFVDEPSQAGHPVPLRKVSDSIVSNWEMSHFGQVFNVFPKLYYRPKLLPSLQDKILLDTSAISDAYDEAALEEYIKNHLKETSDQDVCQVAFQRRVAAPNDVNAGSYMQGQYPERKIQSIFEYLDCIASCRQFLCLMSGGAVAASALGHMGLTPPTTVFMSVPKDIFKFSNIEYQVI